MAQVKVYQFWFYDSRQDQTRLTRSYRTAAEIQQIGFEPALETELDVDDAELDDQGRYHLPEASEER